jgi:metal-responsive CopG/Arc/MetJ family transcriptional regulator
MNNVKHKRGRPVEIDAEKMVGLRLPSALLAAIDAWAKGNGIESRSRAIRELIGRSLVASRRPHRVSSRNETAPPTPSSVT